MVVLAVVQGNARVFCHNSYTIFIARILGHASAGSTAGAGVIYPDDIIFYLLPFLLCWLFTMVRDELSPWIIQGWMPLWLPNGNLMYHLLVVQISLTSTGLRRFNLNRYIPFLCTYITLLAIGTLVKLTLKYRK